MHLEILSSRQLELSEFLKKFRRKFYLVGGTAVAFHIGHRRSIDFDLFTKEKISFTAIKKAIAASGFASTLTFSSGDQIHLLLHQVKLTFFEYPFEIAADIDVDGYYRIPDLLSLAAMKAFALGGRGKWKDYVDLYFIIKHHHTIAEIIAKAGLLFSGVFNGGLFLKQLSYFKDIDYREEVLFMPGFEVSDEEVKTFLTGAALTGF